MNKILKEIASGIYRALAKLPKSEATEVIEEVERLFLEKKGLNESRDN